MQPIIIIGTQRSGSNLLRVMLNQHSQIAAPHPPHILQMFMPLLPKYGDLQVEQNFKQLVKDVCDYVLLNPVPWGTDFSEQKVWDRLKSHTLIGLNSAVYEAYASEHNKTYWCCKSMVNLHYIPQIEAEGVKPIYIHLLRDGRDVAVSFRKAIVGEKHCYHLAKQWKNDQEVAEKNCQEWADERCVPLLYANLTRDPENTLRILMHRIGLPYEPDMLQYYQGEEAQNTADAGEMWSNVARPVMQRNSNKFLTQMTEDEILIYESVAGTTLQRYGFTPYFNPSQWKTEFSEAELADFDAENKRLKDLAQKHFDPEGKQKRQPQEQLIQQIKNR